MAKLNVSRFDMSVIHVDENGVPCPRPQHDDYASDVDYLLAFHAYHDAITQRANAAFDEAFRAEMKRTRRRAKR